MDVKKESEYLSQLLIDFKNLNKNKDIEVGTPMRGDKTNKLRFTLNNLDGDISDTVLYEILKLRSNMIDKNGKLIVTGFQLSPTLCDPHTFTSVRIIMVTFRYESPAKIGYNYLLIDA